MESGGLASNSFSYEGLVRLSILHNNSKKSFWLKNKGTKLLGDIISRSLIRDSIYQVKNIEKPYKIGFVANGNEGVGLSLLRKDVPFSGVVFGDSVKLPQSIENEFPNNIGKVQLTAVITGDAVYTQYSGLKGLQLCISNQQNQVLAYINEDDKETLANIYSALKTQDVLVEWFMLIMNV